MSSVSLMTNVLLLHLEIDATEMLHEDQTLWELSLTSRYSRCTFYKNTWLDHSSYTKGHASGLMVLSRHSNVLFEALCI